MAESGNNLFFATIRELNERLLARDVSAVELARACANRLQELGPRYNALALALPQQAIRKAEEALEARRSWLEEAERTLEEFTS